MTYDYYNSPIERICREAKSKRDEILAHPENFTKAEVENAKLDEYQDDRISLAAHLRYDID